MGAAPVACGTAVAALFAAAPEAPLVPADILAPLVSELPADTPADASPPPAETPADVPPADPPAETAPLLPALTPTPAPLAETPPPSPPIDALADTPPAETPADAPPPDRPALALTPPAPTSIALTVAGHRRTPAAARTMPGLVMGKLQGLIVSVRRRSRRQQRVGKLERWRHLSLWLGFFPPSGGLGNSGRDGAGIAGLSGLGLHVARPIGWTGRAFDPPGRWGDLRGRGGAIGFRRRRGCLGGVPLGPPCGNRHRGSRHQLRGVVKRRNRTGGKPLRRRKSREVIRNRSIRSVQRAQRFAKDVGEWQSGVGSGVPCRRHRSRSRSRTALALRMWLGKNYTQTEDRRIRNIDCDQSPLDMGA